MSDDTIECVAELCFNAPSSFYLACMVVRSDTAEVSTIWILYSIANDSNINKPYNTLTRRQQTQIDQGIFQISKLIVYRNQKIFSLESKTNSIVTPD